MLEKNAVVDVNEEPLSKKRKLNDYDQYLTEGFETMKTWRNETIEDWNDRTRIVGKTGFSKIQMLVVLFNSHCRTRTWESSQLFFPKVSGMKMGNSLATW